MDAQQYGFRGDRSDVDGIQDAPAGTGGFGDAFGSSLSMILVSELGDETFIIAAIMAMRHPRAIVFTGAIGALAVMTVLSTALGLIVPNLISQDVVNKAAFVLYTFFGCRLLYIAYRADAGATMQDEVSEVEEKLGGAGDSAKSIGRVRRILSRICTPIFLEAFVLTFLAEWGDRSQITTIALAAQGPGSGSRRGGSSGTRSAPGSRSWADESSHSKSRRGSSPSRADCSSSSLPSPRSCTARRARTSRDDFRASNRTVESASRTENTRRPSRSCSYYVLFYS